jgi:hypothetical protein
MHQDARGAKRMERDLVGRDHLQTCVVCQRWFIRRKDIVCSIDCLPSRRPGIVKPIGNSTPGGSLIERVPSGP